MVRRAFLVAALLACILLPAEGASPPVRRFPFWACSDGKGTISLFWLPVGGEWPAGGYRLERVSRGRATVLGGPFRPGQDTRAMMDVDPADADAIRSLADKIERGALSDDEKSRSVSALGRAAAADGTLGRALGVRYTDAPRGRGKVVYRLTPLGADGGSGAAMESLEVDPAKATPAPGRPAGLRAEQRDEGVALFWTDPPAAAVAPVVGYRVDRGDGGKRTTALTPKTLLLDRHLRRGEPEFLDGAPPATKVTYLVRGVDLFGRVSAPVRAGITVKKTARARGSSGAATTASKAAVPAAPAPAVPRTAAAPSRPAPTRTDALRDDRGISEAVAAGDRSTQAPTDRAAAPIPATSDAPEAVVPTRVASAAPAAAGPGAPENVAWAAAKPETTARREGPPPPPSIVGIAGLGDRVVVRFRPGEPEDLSQAFVLVRSESPTGDGVTVGRPIPGDAREWEDTNVSAGQYFWYRIVAVDGAGNRSEPSKPKWVSTGSR